MRKFEASSEVVKVNGETILAFAEAIPNLKEQRLATLKKHGLMPIAGQWYPQQKWLDAFKEIAGGSQVSLKLIGQAIIDHAKFPPIDNTEQAFKVLDKAYKLNHKGGYIGYYKFVSFDQQKKEIVMDINTPYPEEFDKGILLSLFRRFKPTNALNKVHCEIKRKDTLIYRLTW